MMTQASGFQRGEMKGILLHLLRDAPAAGHELLQALRAIKHGQYQLGPAEIYPLLASLEAAGYIESTAKLNANDDCQPYQLTRAGQCYIQQQQTDATIANHSTTLAISPPPALAQAAPLQQALAQLHSTLQDAQQRQLSPAELTRIIDILQTSQHQIRELILTQN
ncbi:PadR family transcriptional regulator [Shewanella sp. C32]|uniref:PadR family transcriptional regulator n=1 Tax=Shewanella electrica TaxID=515560 RepID=A0ABT2FQJ9_9GAMM|nr:helix-turn-helix transcriptional regulator [Shewanella electrica]MCH1925933.1 PadR family transcriptional regulator [Shewanella electrica]MCS4557461.1 PadR family transcriptional regulator [Shewanella electrica]